MPRTYKPLKVTLIPFRERTPQERIDDARRFVATLTPAQQRALYAKLTKEVEEERKQAAKQAKGGQAK